MLAKEIRERYLRFFEKKGHKIVASDLLVPENDPTLLFTGAGMNQFKEQFMGKNVTFKRATSSQKCLRTGDLENVGRTPRHHTFFEMLGNFSFGDYFKREAINWAWEFMTVEMKFPKERLWISVYKDDEEAYSIWKDEIKVDPKRIVKLGPDSNFWPADAPSKGPNGPCGPCSEIFFDWGPGTGCGKPDCSPACDCSRFIEVWNLVFTEFERKPDGQLVPLPAKNIDTGMGLERIVSVVQNVPTNFDTDLFTPLTDAIKKVLDAKGVSVPKSHINLIADHIRAVTFCITDGVSPSNEKRGYVVRKLIRRAYMKSKQKEAFLFNLVPVVVGLLKDIYPELEGKREHVAAIVKDEEDKFNETLRAAMPVMEEMLSGGKKKLNGDQVFKLVDTYGMPLDVISDEAETRGVTIDVDTYEKLMEKRKDESRKGSNITSDFIFKPDAFAKAPKPELSGDMPLLCDVVFMLKNGAPADAISEGENGEIITSPQSSVIYTEGGGQVGDAGHIEADGVSAVFVNVCNAGGKRVFQTHVKKGTLRIGAKVKISIDEKRKERTACNHTATHLLQSALRQVLGDQVKQSGSYVDDRRLRFDFTQLKKLTDRELLAVEELANGWIEKNMPVKKETKSLEEAKTEGALSFFGEKYGEIVRMVTIPGASKELCGGTHVDNTGVIKFVKIISESSVASGIRRIEAVTGENVIAWLKETSVGFDKELKQMSSVAGGTASLFKSVPGLDKAAATVDKVLKNEAHVDKALLKEFDETVRP
ncbi:MAG TPA: alanine--tRNA ligase, partial [Candidatus Omnitrophota bacterium]|nr:alanine--tRNA ligase [Candidatus Omnitrophota bacterium]